MIHSVYIGKVPNISLRLRWVGTQQSQGGPSPVSLGPVMVFFEPMLFIF